MVEAEEGEGVVLLLLPQHMQLFRGSFPHQTTKNQLNCHSLDMLE